MTDRPSISTEGNVTALHGGGVNAGCVTELRRLLERAEAGEIVGVFAVTMNSDMTASQTMAGKVGGSMMIGQTHMGVQDLVSVTMAARK